MKVPLLKATLARTLNGLNDPDKMEKASLNNVAYALTQVHTALRLEEGKSTANVSYADALRELKAAKMELKNLNENNPPAAAGAEVPQTYNIPIIKDPVSMEESR